MMHAHGLVNKKSCQHLASLILKDPTLSFYADDRTNWRKGLIFLIWSHFAYCPDSTYNILNIRYTS